MSTLIYKVFNARILYKKKMKIHIQATNMNLLQRKKSATAVIHNNLYCFNNV